MMRRIRAFGFFLIGMTLHTIGRVGLWVAEKMEEPSSRYVRRAIQESEGGEADVTTDA